MRKASYVIGSVLSVFTYSFSFTAFGGAALASVAENQIWINEIFFDPGGDGTDLRDEYIELRGTPGMSLANHWLIFLENENDEDSDGNPGVIENMFNLNHTGQTVGANGFFTLRQRNSPYTTVAPNATNLINMGTGAGIGWGSGATSLVGHTGAPTTSGGPGNAVIENSGFTAMLIRTDGVLSPSVGMDLDVGNDGLDSREGSAQTPVNNWHEHWTIIDSIGIHSEFGEAYHGRLYGMINFGPERLGEPIFSGGPIFTDPHIEPGATYVGTGYEIEYLARWGNSTGQTAYDWHVSNLTDEDGSGSAGVPDWRQSCTDVSGPCHPGDDDDPTTPAIQPTPSESNKEVPYGTKLTTTIGRPNFLLGDFNGDGYVDAADYTVWRNTIGTIGTESNHPAADHNHDFRVDGADYLVWRRNYGAPFNTGGPGGGGLGTASAPEPSSAAIAVAALVLLALWRRRSV